MTQVDFELRLCQLHSSSIRLELLSYGTNFFYKHEIRDAYSFYCMKTIGLLYYNQIINSLTFLPYKSKIFKLKLCTMVWESAKSF